MPAEIFDLQFANCDLFDSYVSYNWQPVLKRKEIRNVVRNIEAFGSKAYEAAPELLEILEGAEVICSHLHTITEKMIRKSNRLKFILSARGGIENINMDIAKEHGINVINCPTHNAIAVTEYTIGLIICEMRNITRSTLSLKRGIWREDYPNSNAILELNDLTVGIIGFGTIGRLVAERLLAFKSVVLVCDPFVDINDIKEKGCIPAQKEDLLRRADVVTLHGRIQKGAPPIIGRNELMIMKPTSYLINTSRAALVDTEALYKSLSQNRIMGAALDVFSCEPLPKDNPFLYLDNVTLTNHRAGDTKNSYYKAPELLERQFRLILKEQEYLNCSDIKGAEEQG